MLMSTLRVPQFDRETQMVIAIKTYTNITIKVIAGDKMIGDNSRPEKRRLRVGFSRVQANRSLATWSGVLVCVDPAVEDFIS
jgi:hypothetical protein